MASKFLKKQILIEFIVLLFFLFVVIYSYFAITNEQGESFDVSLFTKNVTLVADFFIPIYDKRL